MVSVSLTVVSVESIAWSGVFGAAAFIASCSECLAWLCWRVAGAAFFDCTRLGAGDASSMGEESVWRLLRSLLPIVSVAPIWEILCVGLVFDSSSAQIPIGTTSAYLIGKEYNWMKIGAERGPSLALEANARTYSVALEMIRTL